MLLNTPPSTIKYTKRSLFLKKKQLEYYDMYPRVEPRFHNNILTVGDYVFMILPTTGKSYMTNHNEIFIQSNIERSIKIDYNKLDLLSNKQRRSSLWKIYKGLCDLLHIKTKTQYPGGTYQEYKIYINEILDQKHIIS